MLTEESPGSRAATGDYAPHPLITDDAALGLRSTTIVGDMGSTIAHHPAERGSAHATLFLHGAAGSWTTWTPVLREALDRTAPGHTFTLPDPVLLDLPGWGAGILDPRREALTIDAVCETVRAAALALGYSRWHVVGHSMGGFIAMHLAARWPEEVLSVVTVSGTSWSLVESVEHPVLKATLLPHFIALWRIMAVLAALGGAGRALLRRMDDARLLRPAVLPLFRHPFRVDATVIDALEREIRPRSFLAAVDITRGYRPAATWAAISCPVIAVKGDRDALVRDSDLSRLSRLLPASRVAVIAQCGHFANIERPGAVLDVIALAARR